PWPVAGAGQLMGATATLRPREKPYHAQLELARGKVHQLRCQSSDWQKSGLEVDPELQAEIDAVNAAFCHAIVRDCGSDGGGHSGHDRDRPISPTEKALESAYQASEHLVQAYVEQVFHIRRQQQSPLTTRLGCR